VAKSSVKIGDKAYLSSDWLPPDVKAIGVVVKSFQTNDNRPYAVIKWARMGYDEKYGTIFPLDELIKIK
jgi:hypothetical protein